MDLVIRALIDRLSDKGLPIDVIPACIRNALQIIAVDPWIPLEELKAEMRSLGWNILDLDECTFQLIMATLNPDSNDYQAPRSSIICSHHADHWKNKKNTSRFV
jgi:hypothetical protein